MRCPPHTVTPNSPAGEPSSEPSPQPGTLPSSARSAERRPGCHSPPTPFPPSPLLHVPSGRPQRAHRPVQPELLRPLPPTCSFQQPLSEITLPPLPPLLPGSSPTSRKQPSPGPRTPSWQRWQLQPRLTPGSSSYARSPPSVPNSPGVNTSPWWPASPRPLPSLHPSLHSACPPANTAPVPSDLHHLHPSSLLRPSSRSP